MKVKDLFNVISDDREIQIGSYETGRPLTNKNCLAFSNEEFERYSNYDIFMIGIGIDRCGTPYMKILIYTNKRRKKLEQNNLIADIKSDIDKLTTYQLTDKTRTISKKAVDRVFNLHLYGSRDANGKKDSNDSRS